MKIKRSFYIITTFVLMAALFLSGCGLLARKPQQNSPTTEPKKPPKELDQLSQSLEGVFSQLQSISDEINKPISEKMKEEEERQKQEQKQQGQGGQQGQQEQGAEGGQAQETFLQDQPKATQEKVMKMWDETKKSVEELHKNWNSYRPKAVKDGAQQHAVDSFQSDINQLAMEVESKNLTASAEQSNNASKYIADFKELYKTNPPPDIERMKYFVREAHIKADQDQWDEAKRNVKEAKEAWDRAKTKVKKDDMDKMNTLDLSLRDFAQVVEKEQKPLIKMKLDIIMSNIEDMDQSFE